MPERPLGKASTALVLLLALGGAIPAPAAEGVRLAGTVRDSLGQALAGAEILVVELDSPSFSPVAAGRSDQAGRFLLSGLAPGRYRLAALKDGYRTFVGQVDTWVRGSVQVVLDPAGTLDPMRLPQDSGWALRLPRRGILNEVGREPIGPIEPATPGPADDLALELEQLFSFQPGGGGRPAQDGPAPSDTRVTLVSALAGSGSLHVGGRRQDAGTKAPGVVTAQELREALNLGVHYPTAQNGRLSVNAFYNQTDYVLAAPANEPTEKSQQSWGCEAGWTGPIGPAERVNVGFEYRDLTLAGPEASAQQPSTLSNSTVGAHGSFDALRSAGHALTVGLAARMLERPAALSAGAVGESQRDAPTWRLEAEAHDTWSLSVPFAMVYGLRYSHSLEQAGETRLVVPRVGGSVTTGRLSLNAVLAYHTLVGAGDAFAPQRAEGRLGYETDVDLPVAPDVRLRGGASYSPVSHAHFGYARGAESFDALPLYLTDGNASLHEHRLELVESRGASSTYVELTDGVAEGTVAPLLPFDVPPLLRAGQALRYRNGRVGLRFPSSGTDVRFEYGWIAAEDQRPGAAPESVQESIEVRLRQGLSGMQISGDWRLLLALRVGNVRSEDLVAWAGEPRAVDELTRRISAGVSVLF
jgi:hypothetical protein